MSLVKSKGIGKMYGEATSPKSVASYEWLGFDCLYKTKIDEIFYENNPFKAFSHEVGFYSKEI